MPEDDLEFDLDIGRYDFTSFGGVPGALVPGSMRGLPQPPPAAEPGAKPQRGAAPLETRVATVLGAEDGDPGADAASRPTAGRSASARPNPLGSATPFARTRVDLGWRPTDADMEPWPTLKSAMFGGASVKSSAASHAPGAPSRAGVAWASHGRGLRNAAALGGHAFPGGAQEAEAILNPQLAATALAVDSAAAPLAAPPPTLPAPAAARDLAGGMAREVGAAQNAGGPAALDLAGSPFEAAISPFAGTRAERRARRGGVGSGAPREAKAGPRTSPFGKHGGLDSHQSALQHQAYLPPPLTDHMHTVTAKGRKTGAAQYH